MRDGARSDDPAVQAQLDRLEALGHGGDRSAQQLGIMVDLLAALGNPQDHLPPVFHVAGTNGKGSTIAFLRAGLSAAGKRVHAFTSPHLVAFNERIRLDDCLIADPELAPLLREVLDTALDAGLAPSFFEGTTAAAFRAFSRIPADVLLLEVGMGGRLDATNVVAAPAACGIAALGLDHQRWLGETLEEIAREKAGIARRGVPLVAQAMAPEALAQVQAVADAAGAPLYLQGRDWAIARTEHGLRYEGPSRSLSLPHPALPGPHQANNAGLALAMLDVQSSLKLEWDSLLPLTRWARWPARLQPIHEGRLHALLHEGQTLFLDGAHNGEAARAVAASIEGSLHLVMGVLANRDPIALLAPFARKLESFTALPIPGHDHHAPQALAAMVDGTDSEAASDFVAAFNRISSIAKPGDTVLVMGSLYLAGAFLRENGTPPI